jgi:transposase-like protein
VVDGGKAVWRAILDHAGEAAFLQRCQVHKIRNVCEHLLEAQRHAVRFQMRVAYERTETADVRQALYRLHEQLLQDNPSATASLSERLEEALRVIELRIAPRLRRSLASTNGTESSFSVIDRICRQAKRWQGSDQRLRWVASGMLFSESRWNRLSEYRRIPGLANALKAAYAMRLENQRAALRRQAAAA